MAPGDWCGLVEAAERVGSRRVGGSEQSARALARGSLSLAVCSGENSGDLEGDCLQS